MDDPSLWDGLRDAGVDADDPEIRAAVRTVLEALAAVAARSGHHAARRCLEGIHAAVHHELRHPDTGDMSSFESEFDEN